MTETIERHRSYPIVWRRDMRLTHLDGVPPSDIATQIFLPILNIIDHDLGREAKPENFVEPVAPQLELMGQMSCIARHGVVLMEEEKRNRVIVPIYGAIPILDEITALAQNDGLIDSHNQVQPIRIRRTNKDKLVPPISDIILPQVAPEQWTLIAEDLIDGAESIGLIIHQLTGISIENLRDPKVFTKALHEHHILLGVLANKHQGLWRALGQEIQGADDWQLRQKSLMQSVVQTDRWIMGYGPDTTVEGAALIATGHFTDIDHPLVQELSKLTLSVGRYTPKLIGMRDPDAYPLFLNFISKRMAELLKEILTSQR